MPENRTGTGNPSKDLNGAKNIGLQLCENLTYDLGVANETFLVYFSLYKLHSMKMIDFNQTA